MNYHRLLGTILLLGLLGCSPESNSPQALSESPAPASSPQPAVQSAVSASEVSSPLPETSPASSPSATAADSSMQRDYDFSTPIPSTGKVTVRDSIRNLDTSRLITNCPSDSAPYAFAESTHYRIQVCSQEYDPWLPKYYIGQAKDGSGEMHLTSTNLDQARQLIFKNGDYTYIIYRDGTRPETTNAYLEVYAPDGKNSAEALWYLYEASARPPS
jgi:hypothetical protein